MGLILSVISNIMYFSEKFTMCVAAAAVVSCLVVTLIMMLGMGVGLGYNYCFVEVKTKHRYVPGFYRYKVKEATTMYRTPRWRRLTTTYQRPSTLSTPTHLTTPWRLSMTVRPDFKAQIDYIPPTLDDIANENNNSGTEHNNTSSEQNDTDVTEVIEKTTSKTVLQLEGIDLIALLNKLKSENRNYSLQIVTT